MSAITAARVGVNAGGNRILHEVSLDVHAGEVLALVGPNGAGKSTLLGVLAGDITPVDGSVTITGRAISSLGHRERSRMRSVLLQEHALSFPFPVRDVVEMGRSPWARTPQEGEDESAIRDAVDRTDISHLLDRNFPSLSGGEKARVSLARVLAQRTSLVFLDEPTAALDLRHQEGVMRVSRELAAEGRAVVVVLHDLSLAAAYADRLAIIASGELVAAGTPHEVLTAQRIAEVYGIEVEILERNGRPLILPLRG